jgi:hypothetical protein
MLGMSLLLKNSQFVIAVNRQKIKMAECPISVLPLFKKSEDREGGASEFRGAGGPIRSTPASLASRPTLCAAQVGRSGP